MYKVYWDEEALKDLKNIDLAIAKKIISKIDNYLALDPKNLGKPLSSEFSGLFRYRFSNYRIIYEILEQNIQIIIVKVGHRSVVYD